MHLGSRAKITIAVGLCAAAVFLVLGIKELRQHSAKAVVAQRPPSAPAAPLAVLVATVRPIAIGETITADMIRNISADPARYPQAATAAEVVGKVVTQALAQGAIIPRNALDTATKLAIRVPVGMRAMSIDTTAEIAVAGLLRPGDRVDVQVVYPGADTISGARGSGRSQAQTLLQMIELLAVGDTVVGTRPPSAIAPKEGGTMEETRSAAPASAVARTVTLALSPEQVSILSLAKNTGTVYLSLRNPGDASQPQIGRIVSSAPLPSQPSPAAFALPAALPQPAPAPAAQRPARSRAPSQAIDLVVGGSHQVIYSGNDAQ